MTISGTKEWAEHSVNIASGCSHRCLYGYCSAMAVRFGRKTPVTWGTEVVDRAKVDKRYGKRRGRIMFPTTHDITPGLLDDCTTVLKKLLAAGNEVLIVSKPHRECIIALCIDLEPWRDQVMFRFTIGSVNDDVLGLWEPGAPGFKERLWCLAHAHARGYQTSVSCEPMLDRDIAAVVKACEPYVTDSIWLGKANRLIQRMRQNGCTPEQLARGEELVGWQNDHEIWRLYRRFEHHPVVRWKESIKAVVGLELPTEAGLDK
jgi:DNA repair photolyase